MIFTLKRTYTGPEGTTGVLAVKDCFPFCLTLEPPWKDNQKNISCIPADTYFCNRVRSPKYGITFEVTLVENREHILFHWGNRVRNTKGCILLGEEYGYLDGHPAILSSKRAFNEFMRKLEGEDEFALVIEVAQADFQPLMKRQQGG